MPGNDDRKFQYTDTMTIEKQKNMPLVCELLNLTLQAKNQDHLGQLKRVQELESQNRHMMMNVAEWSEDKNACAI